MLSLDHNLAAVGSRRKLEMNAFRRHFIDRDTIHALQHLDAALHLLRLGGLVAETLNKSLNLSHLPLLVGQLCHLAGTAFLHLHHILRIGTLVVVDAASRDLDGAAGDVVEESAVVAHQHHRSGIGREVTFEPLDRDDVEMVGRLVQQKEIGTAQKQLGQLDTHLPAATEHSHRTVKVVVPKPQSQQHLLGRLATVASTQHGNVLGDIAVALQESGIVVRLIVGAFGDLGSQPLQLAFHLIQLAESRQRLFNHRAHSVGHHLLRQVAHRLARSHHNGAALGLLPSTQDLQQRRLAGAVHAHQANTVVVADVEGDILEKVGPRELDRKVVNADHAKKKGQQKSIRCPICPF